MNIIPIEDIEYLTQQSSGRINMVLAGMTALMNDTDNKVETLESQGWFKRMIKTVTGRNKATREEIKRNHDKLNAYMSEAIAELYNRNCIDERVMMSLGIQLNELYADHIQLKKMLGAFVCKLNAKIDSIDNSFMLLAEINQDVYTGASILSICKIISQFDSGILGNKRKLDIIKKSIRNQDIITDDKMSLVEILTNVLEVPADEIGQFYLEIGTIRGNFLADIILHTIEKYHFVSDLERKLINKDDLIEEVILEEKVDTSASLSLDEIYDYFVDSKVDVMNGLIPIAEIQMDAKENEAEKLFTFYKLGEAFELFRTLADKGNVRAMYFLARYYSEEYNGRCKDESEEERWLRQGKKGGGLLASIRLLKFLPWNSEEAQSIIEQYVEPLKNLAKTGDIYAQSELAYLYYTGIGVEQDSTLALKWWTQAADAGDWYSAYLMKAFYALGKNVRQDFNKAIEFLKNGAERGCVKLEYELAKAYYQDEYGQCDFVEAMKWFKKAYEGGLGDAACKLGQMYRLGQGVEVDLDESFRWMTKSAEKGSTEGYYYLGECYECGYGTSIDFDKAKEWHLKAAQNREVLSMSSLCLIEQQLGNYDEAIRWIEKALEMDLSSDMRELFEALNFNVKSLRDSMKKFEEQDDRG